MFNIIIIFTLMYGGSVAQDDLGNWPHTSSSKSQIQFWMLIALLILIGGLATQTVPIILVGVIFMAVAASAETTKTSSGTESSNTHVCTCGVCVDPDDKVTFHCKQNGADQKLRLDELTTRQISENVTVKTSASLNEIIVNATKLMKDHFFPRSDTDTYRVRRENYEDSMLTQEKYIRQITRELYWDNYNTDNPLMLRRQMCNDLKQLQPNEWYYYMKQLWNYYHYETFVWLAENSCNVTTVRPKRKEVGDIRIITNTLACLTADHCSIQVEWRNSVYTVVGLWTLFGISLLFLVYPPEWFKAKVNRTIGTVGMVIFAIAGLLFFWV